MAIIFNEDPNHYIYTRASIDADINEKTLLDFIDQYKGSQISDFMLCVNGSIGWYPCKSRENAIDKYIEAVEKGLDIKGEVENSKKYVKMLHDIYRVYGLDMFQIWLNRLREIGINPWISLRTNDIHEMNDPNNFLNSSFFRDHPEYQRASHRPITDYYDHGLDFSIKEVRDHLMELVKDVLEDFDMHGLEMDWMREIYSVRIGREVETAEILTEFMVEVRAEVDKAAKRWGHPIKLGVRVPSDPMLALRLGFDIIEWVDRDILDLIIVTPRWATCDSDMPIDYWKKLLRGKNIRLAAGLEILLDPMFTEPEKKFLFADEATARGYANAYLSMGADDIALFNYMDIPEETKEVQAAVLCGERYKKLLAALGDLESVSGKPRRNVVTYCDVKAPGVPHRNILPLECAKKGSGNGHYVGLTEYKSVRIPVGATAEGDKIKLFIGVDSGCANGGADFDVYVNTVRLNCGGRAKLPDPSYPGLDYYAFDVDQSQLASRVALLEVGTLGDPFIVKWVEIAVNI